MGQQIAEEPKKGGAPPNNRNAMRHGLYSATLPPGCGYIKRHGNEYRRFLEDQIIERHGQIGVYEAGIIQTAMEAVNHAMKCQHWLREAYDDLTWAERLAFSRDIAKHLEIRDRAVEKLKVEVMGTAADDPFALPLERLNALPPTAPTTTTTPNATPNTTPNQDQ